MFTIIWRPWPVQLNCFLLREQKFSQFGNFKKKIDEIWPCLLYFKNIWKFYVFGGRKRPVGTWWVLLSEGRFWCGVTGKVLALNLSAILLCFWTLSIIVGHCRLSGVGFDRRLYNMFLSVEVGSCLLLVVGCLLLSSDRIECLVSVSNVSDDYPRWRKNRSRRLYISVQKSAKTGSWTADLKWWEV